MNKAQSKPVRKCRSMAFGILFIGLLNLPVIVMFARVKRYMTIKLIGVETVPVYLVRDIMNITSTFFFIVLPIMIISSLVTAYYLFSLAKSLAHDKE